MLAGNERGKTQQVSGIFQIELGVKIQFSFGIANACSVITAPNAIMERPNQRGGWTRFIGLG